MSLPIMVFGQQITLDNTKSYEIRSALGLTLGYITADTIYPLTADLYAAGFRSVSGPELGSNISQTYSYTVASIKGYWGPPIYQEVRSVLGKVITMRNTAGWQIWDVNQQVLIPDTFQDIAVSGPWISLIKRKTNDSGRVTYRKKSLFNAHKQRVVLDSVTGTQPETEGIRLFSTATGWGGLTLRGDTAIPFIYQAVEPFVAGKAIATTTDRLVGILDAGNHWVLPPNYKSAEMNAYGLMVGRTDSSNYLYDAAGHLIDGNHCDSIWMRPDHWIGHRTDTNTVWYNPIGCRMPISHLDLALGQDTIGLFRNGSLWEYRGAEGQVLSFGFDGSSFTTIGPLSEGLAPSKQDGKMGFIGTEGLKRIGHRYDSVAAFTNHRAAVKLALNQQIRGWGYVDRKDSLICQPIYNEVYPYCDSLAVVYKVGKYQVLDYWGKPILPTYADSVQEVNSGGYLFWIKNKVGYLDQHGSIRMLPKYLQLIVYSKLTIAFRAITSKWGIYSTQEGNTLEPIYQEVGYNPDTGGSFIWRDKIGY